MKILPSMLDVKEVFIYRSVRSIPLAAQEGYWEHLQHHQVPFRKLEVKQVQVLAFTKKIGLRLAHFDYNNVK